MWQKKFLLDGTECDMTLEKGIGSNLPSPISAGKSDAPLPEMATAVLFYLVPCPLLELPC